MISILLRIKTLQKH